MTRSRLEKKDSIPAVTEEARWVLEQFLKRELNANHPPLPNKEKQIIREIETIVEHPPPVRRTNSYAEHPITFRRTDSYAKSLETELDDQFFSPRNKPTVTMSFSAADFQQRQKSVQSTSSTLDSLSQDNDRFPITPKSSGSSRDMSSSESEVDSELGPRKKKSLFRRAAERLRQSFKIQKDNRPKSAEDFIDNKKYKQTKIKPKKKGSKRFSFKRQGSKDSPATTPTEKNRNVIGQIHTHTTTHTHQDINSNLGVQLKTEETEKVIDERRRKSPRKHTEIHSRVKESEPLVTRVEEKKKGLVDSLLKQIRKGGKSEIAKKKSPVSPSDPDTNRRYPRRTKSAHEIQSPYSPPVTTVRTEETSDNSKRKVSKVYEGVIQWGGGEVGSPQQTPRAPPHGSGDRNLLRLDGIHAHGLKLHSQCGGVYDMDYDCDMTENIIRTPTGDRRVVTSMEEHRSFHHRQGPPDVVTDGVDDADGVRLQGVFSSSSPRRSSRLTHPSPAEHSKPFGECTQTEKDALFEKIAHRLAEIADNYVAKIESSQESQESQPEVDVADGPTTPTGAGQLTRMLSVERKLAECLREKGDSMDTTNINSMMTGILANSSYGKFESVVNDTLGVEPSVQHLAMLFHFTKSAVGLVGAGGALALQIKENSLRYFEDKIAGWLVDSGGWDSVIEDSDFELD